LRELGYVEGQTIVVEYRFAEGDFERLPTLAAELVGLQPELIVAAATTAAVPLTQVTSTIPIVLLAGNVVAAGLVTNIAHPEGNITGLTTNSVELVGKWVELLKEAVPAMARLATLADPSSAVTGPHLREAELAARALQLEHSPHELRDLDQLPAALSAIKAAGADGLLVLPGGVIRAGGDPRLGAQALGSRLPAVSEARDFAVNGGLMSYGANTADLYRRAATYVDKILKGAKPADLPVELPTTFDLVVNLKTAQALGLTIPPLVLAQATELIQ
jgi:putative ABC transport system substrate-binding protein